MCGRFDVAVTGQSKPPARFSKVRMDHCSCRDVDRMKKMSASGGGFSTASLFTSHTRHENSFVCGIDPIGFFLKSWLLLRWSNCRRGSLNKLLPHQLN